MSLLQLIIRRWTCLLLINGIFFINCSYYDQFKITDKLSEVSNQLDQLTRGFNVLTPSESSLSEVVDSFQKLKIKLSELEAVLNNHSLKGKHRKVLISARNSYEPQVKIFINTTEHLIRRMEAIKSGSHKDSSLLQGFGQSLSKFLGYHNQFVGIINESKATRF